MNGWKTNFCFLLGPGFLAGGKKQVSVSVSYELCPTWRIIPVTVVSGKDQPILRTLQQSPWLFSPLKQVLG